MQNADYISIYKGFDAFDCAQFSIESYQLLEVHNIGVTDKAVSKWERGICSPDISILPKISNLLNTDIDNLLEGNIDYLEDTWEGILQVEGDEVYAGSLVYDKFFCDIWLSYFILAGIRQINICGTKKNLEFIMSKYGKGESLGITIHYMGDANIYYSKRNVMFVRGNQFLYGVNLTRYFQRAMSRRNGISCLCVKKDYALKSNKIFYNNNRKVVIDEDANAASLIPIFFIPQNYIDNFEKVLPDYVEPCGNGFVSCEINDFEVLNDVSNFIRITEHLTLSSIYDVNKISEIRGFINF